VTGGAEGTVRFEWMQGGFFLVQHVELEQYGQRISGIEVIGHLGLSRRRRLPDDLHQDRRLIPHRHARTVLAAEAETDRFASAL
jgi:hypothetical protein